MCWHIQRLRDAQAGAAAGQRDAAARAAEALAVPEAAVLHTSCRVPPPTPSGRARPALLIRARTVNTTGRRLLNVTVSRTGPRDPGTADRPLLHLRRMAATADAPRDDGEAAGADETRPAGGSARALVPRR